MDGLFNTIGCIGIVLTVLAYFLVQHGTLKENDMRYQLLNLIGSLAFVVSLTRFWNLGSFLLNSAWACVSVYGIVKTRRAA